MALSARTRVDLYFGARFGGPPAEVVSTPGRVVLLGEHLDHQGGTVLAVPLREGVHVAWGLRPDRRVALHALNARATDTFETTGLVRSGRRWADLARGVFARLGEGGRRLPGLNLAVYGDLLVGAGLASSAAYVTGLLRAVLAALGESATPARVARDVAAIESAWGGVRCGLMDPYVALAGRPGEVVLLDNRTLTHEILALPPGADLAPEPTGIERRLDRTPYNERRAELEAALVAMRAVRPALVSLVDLVPDDLPDLARHVPAPARLRARHVVTEGERVRRATGCLAAGDAVGLGALLWEGHRSLAEDFDCSLPAIDERVEALRKEPGVLGARLQGAGWGGSLVVLRRVSAGGPAPGS